MAFHHTRSQYPEELVDMISFDPIPDQHQLYDPSIDCTFFGCGPTTPPSADLGELHAHHPNTMSAGPVVHAYPNPLDEHGDIFEIVPHNGGIEQSVYQNATVGSTYGLITPPLEVGELDTVDISTVSAPHVVDTDPNRFLYIDYIEQEIPFDRTSPAYGLWTPPSEPQVLTPFEELGDLFDIVPSDGTIEQPLEQMTFNPTPPPEPRLASTPFDDLGGTLDIAPSDGVIEQTLEHIPFHLALPDPHDQQGPPIAWWPLDDPFSNYSGIEPYQQPAQASQGVLGLSFESVAVPCEQAASQTRASRPFLSQECVASAIISGRGVTNVRYDSSPSRTHPPKHCRRASWQPQQNVGQPNRNETYPGHGSNTRPRYRMKDDSLRSKEDNRPKNMKFVPYAGPDIMTSSNVKVVEHERPQTTTRQSVSNSEVASRPPPATVVGGRESNPKKRRMDSPSLDDQEGVRTRKKMKRISSTPATQSAPSPSRSKVPPHSTTPSSDPSNGSSTALKNARGSRIQKTSPTDSRKKPFTWTGMILNCNGMPGKKNEWRHYS